MFRTVLNNHFRRFFSRSVPLKNSNKEISPQTQSSTPSPTTSDSNSLKDVIKPTEWEKKLLVYSKRYKTKEEIPATVSVETITRAKSLVRIKIANLMIVATLVCCLIVSMSGRKHAREGDSVHKRELHRQEQIKAKARADKLKAEEGNV